MTTASDPPDYHYRLGAGDNDTEAGPRKVSSPLLDNQSKDLLEATDPEVGKGTLTGLPMNLQPFSS